MNPRQLEIFRSIMRDGSLTAAANSLNISQPAVSKVLRHLESQLGYALFERLGGRLVPTMEARLLYEDVDRVFREMESLKSLAMTLRERQVGLLRIGASLPVTYSVAPETLTKFRKNHPAVKVHLRSLPKEQLTELLVTGEIDLALTLSTIREPTVRSEVLASIPMVVVMHDSDPMCSLPSIGPADLAGRELISFDPKADITPALQRAFELEGVKFDPVIQISTSVGAVPLVQGQLGVALLDGLVPWTRFGSLVAVPFSPRIDMTLAASTNSARMSSRFVEPFLRFLRLSLHL